MELFAFSIWQKKLFSLSALDLVLALQSWETKQLNFWVLLLIITFIHVGLSKSTFIKEHNGHKNFITSFVGNSLLYYFCCMWGIRLAMHKVQLNRQNPDHFHNKSSLSFHPDLCARQWFHNLSKPYIQNV